MSLALSLKKTAQLAIEVRDSPDSHVARFPTQPERNGAGD